MLTPIAMGKVAADGTILKATPGIKISTNISIGNGPDIGYTVKLPDRLVHDNNYIVQLTPENYEEDADYVFTSIALRYQTKKQFEVIIWADRSQTVNSPHIPILSVKSNWYFVIYDLDCKCKCK